MPELTRDEVDRMAGAVVLEFGASWCPHCQAIQAEMRTALENHPEFQHIKVEDGKGKPLGRSFRVKLWPTLVFLRGGQQVSQLVRPLADDIAKGFDALAQAK